MADTTNLTLPYLAAGQAQKHVTVNESLRRLDALVQLNVVSATTAAEPGAPSDGALYILPAGKSGAAWGAMANGALAYYRDGAWEEIAPKEGWRAYVRDTNLLAAYDGAAWAEVTPAALTTLIAQRDAGQLSGFRNRLINGGFLVNQRAPASNADDTYCFDRWCVLTESGAIAASQLTDPEAGAAYGLRLTQSQASAQRIGVCQIVEARHCKDLRDLGTTFAGHVRLSASANVRYAVLEWTGSADAVTSDIVHDWASGGYTAGGFFLSSNLNVLAVGQVACTANTWRALSAVNAAVGASANNIIVMVWTEGQVAQNVTLDLNRLQWEPGATATVFELRPDPLERLLCRRYYRVLNRGVFGRANSASVVFLGAQIEPPMRASAAATLLKTAVDIRVNGSGTVTSSGAALLDFGGDDSGFRSRLNGFSGLTAGDGVVVDSVAWLGLDAEL